ncbi:asparagine synthase (glutamine-hydrolyzing) [Luminiphilus sp.]|nr:asparagine synthase (glutamine-hydrolyzing) [Luminiphilus sp.]
MCGIFGYFDGKFAAISDEALLSMGDVISYRGPDGCGIFHDLDGAVGLGNRRLAIIDIENGNQPFTSDCGNYVVVQNGEIFNYLEIRTELSAKGYDFKTDSDTEVILKMYECWGVGALEKLNGMFAIAIYDKVLDTVHLIRDRVGEKPLYYFYEDDRLVFASEVKSVLTRTDGEICLDALAEYLSFNYVPQPRTMFRNIFHVEPGTFLSFDRSGMKKTAWWRLPGAEPDLGDRESEWCAEFRDILDDAVALRLRTDVPFGAFLSGGVDSSSVVGSMAGYLDEPVKTYCIGFTDSRFDESKFAQQAATMFGTQHVCEFVEPNLLEYWPAATYHCDQPHGDVSFLPTYRVARLAAKDVKVVLTGDGADELFAGYDKYANFFDDPDVFQMSSTNFAEKYADSIALFNQHEIDRLLLPKSRSESSEPGVYNDRVLKTLSDAQSDDRINQVLYLDTTLLLSGNNLVKPDRMGMAASIENRSPFLDYRMLEFAFKAPGNVKFRHGVTKYMYKKAVSELIGHDLTYRRKQMFTVPVGEWLRDVLLKDCRDLLISEKVRGRGHLDLEYVEELINEHSTGVENHTRKLRALMALEHWCQKFLDRESVSSGFSMFSIEERLA